MNKSRCGGGGGGGRDITKCQCETNDLTVARVYCRTDRRWSSRQTSVTGIIDRRGWRRCDVDARCSSETRPTSYDHRVGPSYVVYRPSLHGDKSNIYGELSASSTYFDSLLLCCATSMPNNKLEVREIHNKSNVYGKSTTSCTAQVPSKSNVHNKFAATQRQNVLHHHHHHYDVKTVEVRCDDSP